MFHRLEMLIRIRIARYILKMNYSLLLHCTISNSLQFQWKERAKRNCNKNDEFTNRKVWMDCRVSESLIFFGFPFFFKYCHDYYLLFDLQRKKKKKNRVNIMCVSGLEVSTWVMSSTKLNTLSLKSFIRFCKTNIKHICS